jgi:hypothetical protein
MPFVKQFTTFDSEILGLIKIQFNQQTCQVTKFNSLVQPREKTCRLVIKNNYAIRKPRNEVHEFL